MSSTVSINDIPVYIKEGSIITLWKPSGIIHSTKDYNSRNGILIKYFPSEKKTENILYDDNGISKNPVSEIITFDAVTKEDIITLNIRTNNKALYKNGKAKKLNILVPYHFTNPSMIKINGKNNGFKMIKEANYIEIEFKGESIKLQAEIWRQDLYEVPR